MIHTKPVAGLPEAGADASRSQTYDPAPDRRMKAADAPLSLDPFTPPVIEFRKVALPCAASADMAAPAPRLSFRINAGQVVAFRAGPTLRAALIGVISRKLPAAAGAVCLEGRDIWLLSAAEIRGRIALVRAAEHCDPDASLWQSVARGFLPDGCDWGEIRDERQRAAISMALRRVGLLERATEACRSLDACDQLALLIARALAGGPALLLIDATGMYPKAMPALALAARLAKETEPGLGYVTTMIACERDQPLPPGAENWLDLGQNIG